MSLEPFASVLDRSLPPEERLQALEDALAAGADVQATDAEDWSVLHLVLGQAPDLAVVKRLVEAGADAHAVTKEGYGTLDIALPSSYRVMPEWIAPCVACARYLQSLGARPGPGAAIFEYRNAKPEIAEVAFDVFDLDVRDSDGNTPLHVFVAAGPPLNVELLLEHSPPLDAVNDLGHTPIMAGLRMLDNVSHRGIQESIKTLRALGAPDTVPLPTSPDFTPFSSEQLWQRITASSGLGRITRWLKPGFLPAPYTTLQDLAAGLPWHMLDPSDTTVLVKACAEVAEVPESTRVVDGDWAVARPVFHHGDLVVKGNLTPSAPMMVTGSLTVEGALDNSVAGTYLLVGGGITARAMRLRLELHAGGTLNAAELVLASYSRTQKTACAGVVTPVFISSYHGLIGEVQGRFFEVRARDDDQDDEHGREEAQAGLRALSEVLVTGLVREDDDLLVLDEDALWQRVLVADQVLVGAEGEAS